MLEKILKEYFERSLSDIEGAKSRVWRKIVAGMNNVEAPSFDLENEGRRFQFGLMPLMVSLVLVVIGAGASQAYEKSLPGDTLYSFKRTMEDVQLQLAPEANKDELQIALIEKRSDAP